MKGKMSESFFKTLPWRIAARKYDIGFYLILGKDTPDRELQILTLKDGPHPIKEHLDRIRDNAEAIVSAVNSSYGKGYDPVKMVSTLDAIENASEDKGRKGCTWGDTKFDSESVAFGYNLALEHFKKLVNESKL